MDSAADLDVRVKVAIYRHFVETTTAPSPLDVARAVGCDPAEARVAYGRLAAKRVLVLESDGASIRMAPPFSGVPTQHTVEAFGRRYHPNCAWDAFGILAALHLPGTVHSRCEDSRTPFRLEVAPEGPAPSDWLFHCAVPAAHWWNDIVYT